MLGLGSLSELPISAIQDFAAASGPSSGHVIQQHNQVRITKKTDEPRRIDHYATFFFRRAAAVLAIQPFWIFTATAAQQAPLEEIRQPDHSSALFFNRTTVTPTASSGHVIQPHQTVRVTRNEIIKQPDHSALFFNRTAVTPSVTVSQPFWMWSGKAPAFVVDAQIEPVRHAFRYAVGAAPTTTANQPYWIWQVSNRVIDSPEFITQQDHYKRLFYGRTTPVAPTASQPFWIWSLKAREDAPQEAITPPQQYYRYAVGTVTVTPSQPFWIWPKTTVTLDYESIRQPSHSLLEFRQTAPVVLPGQPWYFWKPVIGSPTPEEAMYREDHAAALYPFRPHPYTPPEPPPTPADFAAGGGDDRPRARRHKGFDLKEWRKAHAFDDELEATIKRVWAEIKGEAPVAFVEAAKRVVNEPEATPEAPAPEVDWKAFASEWEQVYNLMQVYDDWQQDEDDLEFLLLHG